MKFYLAPCIFLVCMACTEVSFKEPQPKDIKELSEIPAKLLGVYQTENKGNSYGEIEVFSRGYRILKENDQGSSEEYTLSDSLVVKHYKGYYFVNIRDDGVWILRVVKREKNGNLILMEMPALSENAEKRNEQLTELRKIAPVIETEVNGMRQFIMEPSPRQLLQLIKKGYFKEQTYLKRK
ncbi:MAG: hypothetical protein NZM13_06610 [Cyclobacteriaceae bacterium]|nr:hypothetical protein [Cyclobacteriaceae bacterium]MDW8331801.1 hypothetical protein [Cyclobacteriaceae bacterium]